MSLNSSTIHNYLSQQFSKDTFTYIELYLINISYMDLWKAQELQHTRENVPIKRRTRPKIQFEMNDEEISLSSLRIFSPCL